MVGAMEAGILMAVDPTPKELEADQSSNQRFIASGLKRTR
jgi:hypothetical protein